MNHVNTNGAAPLDVYRSRRGKKELKAAFLQAGSNRPEEAAALVNDDKLRFASLFLLMPEIEALNLYPKLSPRNLNALKACAKIGKNAALEDAVKPWTADGGDETVAALKWMFESGAGDDGLDDGFDETVEGAASLLINLHKEKSILPPLADLIFKRNRKGYPIHDLTWIFFKAHIPDVLRITANYLRSPNPKDRALACQLLDFRPARENSRRRNPAQNGYSDYLAWLDENASYLQFTNESFNLTNAPHPCKLDLSAKYLHKAISPHNGKPAAPLSEEENRILPVFSALDEDAQTILARYSDGLFRSDKTKWGSFIKDPIENQIKAAKANGGGVLYDRDRQPPRSV